MELVTLCVIADNIKAIHTYIKVGFVSYGHLDNYFKHGNKYYPVEYMALHKKEYKR